MAKVYTPKRCKSCKYRAVMFDDYVDGNTCILDDFSALDAEDIERKGRPESCPFNYEEDPVQDKYALVEEPDGEIIFVGTYDECKKYRNDLLADDDSREYAIEKLEEAI